MTAIEPQAIPARRLEWRRAKARQIIVETSRVKSLLLDVAGWPGHLPGQHVDVRLTGEDGYQAQRSYSIVSPAEDTWVALTVERVENGEVSPYLVDEIRPGDQFELRGPIGGYFVWTVAMGGPLCLIAAGSGIAPLMAMLRHRDRQSAGVPSALLYSARSAEDVIYGKELAAMARRDPALRVVGALTRKQPDGWTGYRRRVDKPMLAEACFPPGRTPRIYVCGPTPFVEDVSSFLVELGHDASMIKTERFGPTGGPA
jgi:ferredoxin-NADP reductase